MLSNVNPKESQETQRKELLARRPGQKSLLELPRLCRQLKKKDFCLIRDGISLFVEKLINTIFIAVICCNISIIGGPPYSILEHASL